MQNSTHCAFSAFKGVRPILLFCSLPHHTTSDVCCRFTCASSDGLQSTSSQSVSNPRQTTRPNLQSCSSSRFQQPFFHALQRSRLQHPSTQRIHGFVCSLTSNRCHTTSRSHFNNKRQHLRSNRTRLCTEISRA